MAKKEHQYRLLTLAETGSTNEYAAAFLRSEAPEPFTVIRAVAQLSGKGQKGSSWESEDGKNLTFTIITYPDFLPPEKQFYLSIVASLAVTDFLKEILPAVQVKWPNDIYFNSCKLGGILIENSLALNKFRNSLVGIGLNINQENFISDAPNPVSLANLTGKQYSPEDSLNRIMHFYWLRYHQLSMKLYESLFKDYYSRLLGYRVQQNYEASGRRFIAMITGIKETGELVLEEENGDIREFSFREVSLITE